MNGRLVSAHACTDTYTRKNRERERKRNEVTLKVKLKILPGRQFNVIKEGYILSQAADFISSFKFH